MNSGATPEISLIVITPDDLSAVENLVTHLQAQTVRDRLELVVVAPSAGMIDPEDDRLNDFGKVQVVEIGPMRTTAHARAAGIRQASAPVVALTEEHSFPQPDWAQILIRSHRERWASVGPAMENANPHSMLSWANLLIEYGPYLDPVPAGVVDYLPGHNSSYKRDVLLEYGVQLDRMLEAEYVLHDDLRAKGYELYLESAARTRHLNFSAPWAWISLRVNDGRAFAALRSERWSILRRMAYAVASPLIPFVRLSRIMWHMKRVATRCKLMPRVLPALITVLVTSAFGEMLGYIFGEGRTAERFPQMEFNRIDYLSRQDRERLHSCDM